MAPPSPPPLPPYTPFTECQTTCESVVADGDTKCRDGGKDSWLPTMCPYATQCAQCGFRENTARDRERRHVRHGQQWRVRGRRLWLRDLLSRPALPGRGQTTNCGLGTDATDCCRLRAAHDAGDQLRGLPGREQRTARRRRRPRRRSRRCRRRRLALTATATRAARSSTRPGQAQRVALRLLRQPGEIATKRAGTWVNPATGVADRACPQRTNGVQAQVLRRRLRRRFHPVDWRLPEHQPGVDGVCVRLRHVHAGLQPAHARRRHGHPLHAQRQRPERLVSRLVLGGRRWKRLPHRRAIRHEHRGQWGHHGGGHAVPRRRAQLRVQPVRLRHAEHALRSGAHRCVLHALDH